MTTDAQTLSRSTSSTIDDLRPAGTLAGEHARLTRDVTRRAEPVLALLDTRAWPHAELGTLTAFLRTAVLRQASEEEAWLFPPDATAPPFAELSADHVRLHTLTAQLERAYHEPCAPRELRDLVDELLRTLQRHLHDEREILAALADASTEVPSAAGLATGAQSWSFDDPAVTWAARTEQPGGLTSPEELAAAAHSSCFAMALELRLGERRTPPQQLRVQATVTLGGVDGLPTIISSRLLVTAEVTGLDGDAFQAAVDEAAALCAVSRLFAGARISVEALLEPS